MHIEIDTAILISVKQCFRFWYKSCWNQCSQLTSGSFSSEWQFNLCETHSLFLAFLKISCNDIFPYLDRKSVSYLTFSLWRKKNQTRVSRTAKCLWRKCHTVSQSSIYLLSSTKTVSLFQFSLSSLHPQPLLSAPVSNSY